MNRVLGVIVVLGLVGQTAHADVSVGVGVATGMVVATRPPETGFAADVSARLVWDERYALQATAGGTAVPGEEGAQSELVFALSAGARLPISPAWTFSLAAGPALVVVDSLTAPVSTHAGAWASPLFEWQARRRSLAVQAGARGLWFPEGWRVGPMIGVVYSFR